MGNNVDIYQPKDLIVRSNQFDKMKDKFEGEMKGLKKKYEGKNISIDEDDKQDKLPFGQDILDTPILCKARCRPLRYVRRLRWPRQPCQKF